MNDVFHGTDLPSFKTALKQLRRPDLEKNIQYHREIL